ncbi:MAG: hypothetical protein AMXMBFR56_57910 [Polyangiaceae bacterium]
MRVHHDPEPDAKVWDPVVLQPGYYTAETLPMIPVADGDPVTVRFASQGGYVIFAGARAQGLDPGPARIDSALIDPDTGVALVVDARVVELIPSADGSGAVEPDFQSSANFSHLLPCPNYGARPVTTADWTLSVKLADPKVEARSGSASIRVKPTCAPGSRYLNCVCSCEPNYYLGKCGAEH